MPTSTANVMTRVLFIKASPRGQASASTAIAQAYLTALQTQRSDIDIDELDLWTTHLPVFDGDKVGAKMKVLGQAEQSVAERSAWDEVMDVAQRFVAADHYLISTPMWNGGIPYRMKHFIDLVHQPGVTFGLTAESGYFGLLKGKRATLIVTAGAFSPDFPSPQFGVDHQSTYLEAWLNQAGVTDIDIVRFQPSLLTANPEGDLRRAKEEAIHLATHWRP